MKTITLDIYDDREKIIKWCYENFGRPKNTYIHYIDPLNKERVWNYTSYYDKKFKRDFTFDNDADAMLFKLQWC